MQAEHKRGFPTHVRLALLGALAVVSVMCAATVSFNAFESWHLEREAEASLDESMGWEPDSGIPATRAISYLFLTEDGLDTEDMEWYSDLDIKLAAWCQDHIVLNQMLRAELEDATCYVEMAAENWNEGGEAYSVCYVDVTDQVALIATVNLVFAVITLIGVAVASAAGWAAGTSLEEADAARKRFFENMSHELKTPLAAIVGNAEGIETGVIEARLAATRITSQAERMATIVNQIMDLSRLEAGQVTPTLERLDLAELVQDALMPFETIARAKSVEVDLTLSDATIEADRDLMSHALENICANAFRHAGSYVRVRADEHSFSVTNDGDVPGEDEVGSLFSRYATTQAAHGGTGIGLALTKEICDLHGFALSAALEGDLLCVRIDF